MLNINETRLMGRLSEDPTFGKGANGHEYMRVRVITSKSYKDEQGEWKERTTGHNVTTFDSYRIQHGRDRLRKGMMVYVEGENAESKRVENGQTSYFRGVLVPLGGKLHSIEPTRSRDERDSDEGYARQPEGRSAQRAEAPAKAAKNNVPDGPAINGQNPIDQHDYYDDDIPL